MNEVLRTYSGHEKRRSLFIFDQMRIARSSSKLGQTVDRYVAKASDSGCHREGLSNLYSRQRQRRSQPARGPPSGCDYGEYYGPFENVIVPLHGCSFSNRSFGLIHIHCVQHMRRPPMRASASRGIEKMSVRQKTKGSVLNLRPNWFFRTRGSFGLNAILSRPAIPFSWKYKFNVGNPPLG